MDSSLLLDISLMQQLCGDNTSEDVCFAQGVPQAIQGKDLVPAQAFLYIITEAGTLSLSINGIDYQLVPGQLAIISTFHHLVIPSPSETARPLLMMVSNQLYAHSLFRHKVYFQYLLFHHPVISLTEADAVKLTDAMEDIRRRSEDKDHTYYKASIQLSAYRFLLDLSDVVVKKSMGDGVSASKADQTFVRFVNLLTEHVRIEHTVPFYADRLHMTEQRLSLLIKQRTGMPAGAFINDRLYHEARILLHDTTLSIREIADELNFSDQSAFGKFFKGRAGISPVQFREAHLLENS